jgi:glycosyltransferase involved in cell wall biosynthesis
MKIGICGPILVEYFREYLNKSCLSEASCPKGVGGIPVNLLARELLKNGHQVVLFSLDMEVKDEVILDGPRLRICMGRYRRRARWRILDFFGAERRYLCRAIKREKLDIVHAHWTYEYALGALASGIPTLVTVRDWAPIILGYYRNIYRFVRLIMNNMALRRARYLTANSVYIQELLYKKLKRLFPVIPNPIEDSFLRIDEKPFPASVPVIISVSSGFGGRKNHQTLLRAFPLIRREFPNCRLHLVGDGFEPGGEAEQWAAANGLNDGIVYLGELKRDELRTALDSAAMMVHPSLEESFGNVLIEAMARRVPVVAGRDAGAVPWVLDDGKAGVLCDVRNSDAIAQSAVRILNDKNEWNRFSCAGYNHVVKTFKISGISKLFEAEYRKILNLS